MKKTLIAVAALAATGAFAQVSVYGRLDAGYANTKTEVNGVSTKANGIQSHNSASSFWGIQGSEDLGGGLKAMFKLEQDVYIANGNVGVSGANGGAGVAGTVTASAQAGGTISGATSSTQVGFNRTSLVGLSGGFGSIALGRDYVPTFKLASATDVNLQSRITTVNLAGVAGSTLPNLVHYSTPNLSGFQVNVAVGNQDTTVSSATGKSTAKVTNITATYMNGPLMVGVGSGSTETKSNGGVTPGSATVLGVALGTVSIEKANLTVLAASYDLGVVKLSGNALNAKWDLVGGTEVKASELNIGATMPMGKVTLAAQLGTNKLETSTLDVDGNDFIVGANYALSAKTSLFAKTGTYSKVSGGSTDVKSTSTAVGIRTVF